MHFDIQPSKEPVDPATRAARLADPGFGKLFTDHMAEVRYTEGRGWHDAVVRARAPIAMDPATSVLHYAQEIFEGMKAYRMEDGAMALFRPRDNARRFAASARRMAMPELPEDVFLASIERLVAIDRDWFPPLAGGSLYLRPFMFASEVFLGVRPAREYTYLAIASPVGAYFRGDADAASTVQAVRIWISDDYSRAAPGGTGAAKCGGNYAASLVAQAQATANSCDQVAFLDAREGKWIEELGGMNLFFVFADGSIATPPLAGTILPGITRDSLLRLARDEGISVREEPYALADWRADAASGKLVETFACGTAAVVTAVGEVHGPDDSFRVADGAAGPVTQKLHDRLVAIQRGRAPDPHGWVHRLG